MLIVYHNSVVFRITIIFVDKDGEEIPVKVPIGMSVLEAAHENDIDLEGAHFSSIFFSFSIAYSHSFRWVLLIILILFRIENSWIAFT